MNEMTDENKPKRNRRRLAAMTATVIVLAVVVAVLVTTFTNGKGAETSKEAEGIKPTDSATNLENSPRPTISSGTITQIGETVTTTTYPKGYKPPAAKQTITNSNTAVTVKPKTTPAPSSTKTTSTTTSDHCAPNVDSATWAACTKGYIAPTVQFTGISSCKAVAGYTDRWLIREEFRVVGGSYKGFDWQGTTGGSHVDLTVMDTPREAFTSKLPVSFEGTKVLIRSMNGLPGWIDEVDVTPGEAEIVLGKYCA